LIKRIVNHTDVTIDIILSQKVKGQGQRHQTTERLTVWPECVYTEVKWSGR